MRKELKNVTDREARRTAFVVAAVLLLASAFLFYRDRMIAASAALIPAVFLLMSGAFLPGVAKLFHRGWMTLAFALGYVNSRIILTLIFFLVFLPYGIISRLFRRDPLNLRGKNRDSYWHGRETPRQERDGFERLF